MNWNCKKLALSLFSFLISLSLFATDPEGNGTIKGKITTADGSVATDVSVLLKHKNKAAVTNEKGEFEFRKLIAGTYELEISLVGYETVTETVVLEENKVTTVSIQLKLSGQQLEQVVVTGSKAGYKVNRPSSSLRLQTPLLEVPQNIQVVTSRQIADQQIFDMLEGVTRNVSGATRSEHWDNYANIVMRGTTVGSFRNGMNVQMPWGPLAEDMSMVERIEFVKGPAGFMLANGEPSGFYNVVTKKPTGQTKGEVSLTLGSYDTYRSTLDLDGSLTNDGKLLYRLNLMGQLKGSHRDFEYTNRYSIVPVLTYKLSDKTSLTAEYTYQYLRMSMIGSAYVFSPKGYGDLPRSFSTAEPNLEPSDMKDQSIYLTLTHQLNPSWKFTTQLAYLNYKQEGYSMWPSNLDAEGNLTRSVGIWDAFSEGKLAQAFLNGEVATGPITHRILAGVDMGNKNYMADWNQSATLAAIDANGDPVPFNIYDPVHGNIRVNDLPGFDRSKSLRARANGNILGEKYSSLYIQDELRFWKDRIRLTLAGRYTSIKQEAYGAYSDDQQFTPRAGISISLDKQTSLYALYDQAFVTAQGFDSAKLRPLVPITGNNVETGIKRDWFGGHWNTTLTVFQIIRNNIVTYRPGLTNYATQIGQSKTRGVEVDLRGEIFRGLNLNLNYGYTEAKVTKDEDASKVGTVVPGSGFANHVANGWVSYGIRSGKLKGIGVSLGYQWQGSRNAWDWGSSTPAKLPDYFRLDGNVSWQSNQFSVALNVNNILNKYLYMGAPYDVNWDGKSEYYYQTEPGTNLRLTIGYKF
jgi:iron complex outermembrane recepter protein